MELTIGEMCRYLFYRDTKRSDKKIAAIERERGLVRRIRALALSPHAYQIIILSFHHP